jgi:hypothetical protein
MDKQNIQNPKFWDFGTCIKVLCRIVALQPNQFLTSRAYFWIELVKLYNK